MELEEEEKRKAARRVYTLTKFFKVEYEVNPSFTEPLVTRLFLLPATSTVKRKRKTTTPRNPDRHEGMLRTCRAGRGDPGPAGPARELYQKKVELHNRLRGTSTDSFEDVEEKEVLSPMLGTPRKTLELSLPELAAPSPSGGFSHAVLRTSERQGYMTNTGGFYGSRRTSEASEREMHIVGTFTS